MSQEREKLKNEGIKTKDAGDLTRALGIFENLKKVDENNKSKLGVIETLGHIRAVLAKLADESKTKEERSLYLKKAFETARETVEKAEEGGEETKSSIPFSKVHLASATLAHSENQEIEEKTKELENALLIINEAMGFLQVNQARKAWPLTVKAKILYELDRENEAFKSLLEAEECLYKGYETEKEKDSISHLLSGVHLAMANFCKKEGKVILAKHYAAAVLSLEDPKNTLGERKKEATRLLSSLK